MDDHKFDKLIKDKVEHYQYHQVDEGALADMRSRLSGLNRPSNPFVWSSIGKYAASIALVSFINFIIFWYWHKQHDESLLSKIELLSNEKNELNAALNNNSVTTEYRVDTVYVYNNQPSRNTNGSDNNPEVVNQNYAKVLANREGSVNPITGEARLSDALSDFLKKNNLVLVKKADAFNQTASNEPQYLNHIPIDLSEMKQFVNINIVGVPSTNQIAEVHHEKKKNLPPSLLNDIEKQKMHGIGWHIGPSTQIFRTIPKIGEGKAGIAIGLIAEMVLSPSLRIESGFSYQKQKYEVNAPYDDAFYNDFPSVDTSIGELNHTLSTSEILAMPVHIKYMIPTARDKKLFVSTGLSTFYFISREFNYRYNYDIGLPDSESFTVNIEANKKLDAGTFDLGTLDFVLGFEKQLKNKSYFTLATFYNHGLSNLDLENNNLSVFGLKSSYTFKIK